MSFIEPSVGFFSGTSSENRKVGPFSREFILRKLFQGHLQDRLSSGNLSQELEGLCDMWLLPAHAPFPLSVDWLSMVSHSFCFLTMDLPWSWGLPGNTSYHLHARYVSSHSKHFPYSCTLNPNNKPTRHVLWPTPFYRWRHWDRKRWGILPQITWVGNDRAGARSQAIWLNCSFPVIICLLIVIGFFQFNFIWHCLIL